MLTGCIIGFIAWFIVRYGIAGLYIVGQNERAVKTRFGRADRIPGETTLNDPISEKLTDEQKPRYTYPQVRVIRPGGPYWKWPWEQIHKVSIATQTINMAYDPDDPSANYGGTILEAVTKDQMNILRQIKSLRTIGIDWPPHHNWPADQFWKKYEAGDFK